MMDFHSTHVFSVKKADYSTNFAAGRIVNRRSYHNWLCRDKNKLGDQLSDGLQGNESRDAAS
jgi:hypothetical protein